MSNMCRKHTTQVITLLQHWGSSESQSLFNSLTQRKYTNKQALKVIWGLREFKAAGKRPSAAG